jgi:flotillin
MEMFLLAGAALAAIVLFGFIFAAKQYRRCSSDEVLVVFGKVGSGKTAECVHGGGKLIIPLIQDFKYLSLKPMSLEIPLKGALSKENIRVNVPSTFTIAISTKAEILQNAAERLLGLTQQQIMAQAHDVILGQLRLVIANMTIMEINTDRDKFLEHVNQNVGQELSKLGLMLINVNVQDITDEAGYIAATGKRAAEKALQEAAIAVAEQQKTGAMGVAEATREREITVAQRASETAVGKSTAERDQRVQTASLQAEVAKGENEARAKVAEYNATLQEKEAEALRRGQVAKANAERDMLKAQKETETARLEKEQLALQEVERKKMEVEAAAKAEQTRIIAQGEADAIRAKYAAEAEGIEKVLTAKAEGYKKLISAAGNAELAPTLLMIEKLDSVVEAQAEMVKNIKIDKITVWDSGKGETGDFVSGLTKMIPPFHDVAANAGIKLPEFLGTAEKAAPKAPPSNGSNGSGLNGIRNT